MKQPRIIIIVIIFLFSCSGDSIRTDDKGNKVFTYEPTGWQMLLPAKWEILNESERDKLAYKAESYYEEDMAAQRRGGKKKIILGVRKGEKDMNAIYAFIRSYERDEDFPDLEELLTQQYRSYATGEYSADSSLARESLSGIVFDKAILKVSYAGKPYFTYITYSAMLDTLNFGVSIVTNNAADEQMLVENFRQSIGSIRLTK
ncbi:MAG: hypothetical protein K8F30_10925 [Taibaiella sp.]|nr:hypothetical protein [Taibaiella sp.]